MLKRPFHNINIPTIILFIILVIDLTFIVTTHLNWQHIMKKYIPLQKNIMSLRHDISEAHLWFEEIISGDKYIDINRDVMEKIAQKPYFTYYTSIHTILNSPKDQTIIRNLDLITNSLLQLEKIAKVRWEKVEQSGIGSDIDQKFDKVYINLLNTIDKTLSQINLILDKELNKRNYFFLIILILFTIVNILMFFILYRVKKNESQSKQELIKSNQFINSVIDSIDNLIFVKDTNSVYITCNKAYEKFIGTSRENIIGKTDYDFYDEELAKSFRKHDKLMLQEKRVRVDFEWASDLEGKEHYWLTTKSPLIDLDGKITGLVGNCANFTDQKKLYELLKDAQKLAKLGSWEQTFENNILYWSEEVYHIFEFEPQDSMDFEQFMSRVHPSDQEKLLQVFEKSIDEQDLYYLEHRLLFPDNRIKYVVERAKHYYDKNNKRIRTLGTIQDITEHKIAQQEIQKQETIISSIFEVIPDLLFIMKNDGTIIDYKAQPNSKFYVSPEKFINQKMQHILPKNVATLFNEHISNIQTGGLRVFEYKLEIDNKIKHFEARLAQLPYENKIMVIVRNITEQVINQQQVLFQSIILEQSFAATSILNENRLLYYVNNSYVKLWGYNKKEEVLNTPYKQHCHDSKMPEIIIKTVEQEGYHVFNFKARKKDNSLFSVLMAVKYIYFDNQKYYICSSIDISDLVEQEEKLKEAATVFENINEGIIIIDHNGIINNVNKGFINITGYSYNECIGQNFSEIQFSIDKKDLPLNIWDTLKKQGSWSGQITNQKRNGDKYTSLLNISSLQNEENKTKSYIGVFTDITKIVKYEKELREKDIILAQQAKMAAMGEMIDSIAHQWKQPLSTISMETGLIEVENQFKTLTNEKLNKSLENITNSITYMSDTINDFRNFFKPNKLKRNLYLDKTIKKILGLLKSKLIKKHITIIKDIENIEIKIIENELVQVLINILNNAIDALEENTNIDKFIIITIKKEKEIVKLSIKDNAGGIPQDIIDKVFDARFTTKEENKGSGIGLYMSQKIIKESLKGKIYVQNTNFTYNSKNYLGAKFTIELK